MPVAKSRYPELAEQLRKVLAAQSVLVLEPSDSLARELCAAGMAAYSCPYAAAGLPQRTALYDVVLCLEAPALPAAESEGIARAVARIGSAVLFSSTESAAIAAWLRAFAATGFTADLHFDVRWAGHGAALLRPGGTGCDSAAVMAELLSLRARVADSASGDLERSVRQLQTVVAGMQEREDAAREIVELRLALLHSRTNQLTHSVQTILRSRIWRSLVAAGGVLLRARQMTGALGAARSAQNAASTDAMFRVHCDEPAAAASVNGNLLVRGWAVSASGIQSVELQLADQPPVKARYGLYRPDLGKALPGIPGAERAGFQGQVDTMAVPNGLHPLVIRARNGQGASIQTEVAVTVDHVHTYVDDYHRWIAEYERRDVTQIQLKLAGFEQRPKVSILVPVYRTPPEILERTIASVVRQSYPDWELCLADDCSRSPELDALLDRHAASDARIKVVRLPENRGISAASNAALAIATGELIGLLDHDDELAEDALFHVVDALHQNPGADLLYSDEDHLDEEGLRSDPFFKPDWSPDLMLSENYVCHFLVMRTGLCRKIGGFRSETDRSQDHDITLRASMQAQRIVHIPRILYHWRTEMYSTERASTHLTPALESSRRAIEDHLRTLQIDAAVEPCAMPFRWLVRYRIAGRPAVRIIIPCGGRTGILKRCLDSIAEKTSYPDYELVVVDNSQSGAVEQFVNEWSQPVRRLSYVDYRNRPFQFSAMINQAARDCDAPLLLFLNDDVAVIDPDWLTGMVELASQPGVGAVGAKLLYPDGTIQHAGVVVGIYGVCGHAFRGVFDDARIHADFPHVIRNVSAVTGACMMTPAKVFRECGGFDEEAFPVAYQDVDYCLRLREKGYRVLYTPVARLYHYEAASKRPEDRDPRPSETLAFKTRWKHVIEADPFYNPNLTITGEDFSCRKRMLAAE
ncbi:MAG TPA: glycosyltransferase family 2 protein [Bryobacteraceae bacterium]|nr:glycosyltransferase family 2 protein [Bryobacteraceae bacterium]